MAKVKMGLLSGKATGSIGKTLTFANWKGINTVRQTPMPSNPRTTAQTAQRTLLAQIVTCWKLWGGDQTYKTTWNLLAAALSSPMSGFNAFTQSAIKAILTGLKQSTPMDDIGFAFSQPGVSSGTVTIVIRDPLTNAQSLEASVFTLWLGSSPSKLSTFGTFTNVNGNLSYTGTPAVSGAQLFGKITAAINGVVTARSGVFNFKNS